MRIHVRVPAASGNLGSGFDSAGMALALYNDAVADTEAAGVTIEGEGAAELPTDERNHCIRAMRVLSERTGRELPGHALCLTNRIPIGRGLASSGAAVIAGLVLANELLGRPCDVGGLVDLGTELEGHPDNVAAAMLGGVVISAVEHGHVHAVRLEPPPGMRAVLWVPEAQLTTKRARAALPTSVGMGLAVYNLSRAALFAAAFATGNWQELRVGGQDALHQPHRAALVEGLYEIMDAALEAGAVSAWLSGAGPSILALCLGDTVRVETAMRSAASGQLGRVEVLGIDASGVRVTG